MEKGDVDVSKWYLERKAKDEFGNSQKIEHSGSIDILEAAKEIENFFDGSDFIMTPQKEKYLNLIKTNPIKFGHMVGFPDLTDIHNEWLKSFLFAGDDQTLLSHRGSFKTTTLAIAIAFLMILFPNKNYYFFA